MRYERIGDLLLATAAIRAIAVSHPTITVDVLAAPENEPVLRGNPFVRRVLQFRQDWWWTWPALLDAANRYAPVRARYAP